MSPMPYQSCRLPQDAIYLEDFFFFKIGRNASLEKVTLVVTMTQIEKLL